MKKIFLMAAAAATVLTACTGAEENLNNGGDVVSGQPAGITLTFEIPAGTRAAGDEGRDVVGTNDENAILTGTAALWIFNTAGEPVETGAYTELTLTGSGDTYTSQAIETLSGNVRIYVGANLPTAAIGAAANEVELLARFANVADMDDTGKFTMVSEATPATIQTTGTMDAPQPVSVIIDRVVSKLVGTTRATTFNPMNEAAVAAVWGTTTVSYNIVGYNVFQNALTSYIVERATPKAVVNDGINKFENAGDAAGVSLSASGAVPTTFSGNYFYIGENFKHTNSHANTTFAMVSATFSVSETVTAVNDKIVVTTGNYNSDMWVVRDVDNHKIYFVKGNLSAKETTVDAVAQVLLDNSANVTAQYFPAGNVHFLVYLNKDGVNDYNIRRNEFIHLHVEGIDVVDGAGNPMFPGYPDGDTPGEPIDPTDPDPEKNPDEIKPENPIDGSPVGIKATVTVKGWTYRWNGVTLD